MWTTFLVALKANLRNRQALFWMIVFPIVLATMFNGFFGGLSEGYELKPIPMAVVEDSRWQQADGARTFVDALSGDGLIVGVFGRHGIRRYQSAIADHHRSRHRAESRTAARRWHSPRLPGC